MKKILYILLPLIIFSCTEENVVKDNVIAKVGDAHLYKSDVNSTVNKYNIDSNVIATEYINYWIIEQLEYQEAIKSIKKDNSELEELIEDYRKFLYVDKFKKEYIKKNLDTIVSNDAILRYYNNNKSLYILKNNIVKATYIKTGLKAPKLYKLKQWLKSDKLEDQELLSTYCVQYADKYDDFEDNWVDFDGIINNIPKRVNNPSKYLTYTKQIEARDSTSYYLVNIKEYKLVNDTSPVGYIKGEVVKSIIKQRKKDILITLKKNLLEEGKSNGVVEKFE